MCFDWLFNLQIPASTKDVVIVRPSAKTWVNGLATAYSEDYDAERLSNHIEQREY